MTRKAWAFGACVVISGCGGTAANEPAAATASPNPPAVEVVAPEPVAAETEPALSTEQVAGLWCEYWIAPAAAETPASATPTRTANTQQYLFLADGRFGWRAEPETGQEPTRRSGTWRVVGDAMVLMDDAGQVIERLAIADCPDNPEAQQLDAAYQCRSLGGKAFWLRLPPAEVDASEYIR